MKNCGGGPTMLKLYAATTRRVLPRSTRLGSDQRLVFVVGSPRSGTTFLGTAIGSLPGFVDLGEVAPLKAAVPEVYGRDDAAARIRTILDRVRRLGLVTGLRAVEQTPEVSFVVADALRAFPQARAVHIVRDGRDVVCSLLERGWLGAERTGADDARLPYGARARFWVEPERAEEFETRERRHARGLGLAAVCLRGALGAGADARDPLRVAGRSRTTRSPRIWTSRPPRCNRARRRTHAIDRALPPRSDPGPARRRRTRGRTAPQRARLRIARAILKGLEDERFEI